DLPVMIGGYFDGKLMITEILASRGEGSDGGLGPVPGGGRVGVGRADLGVEVEVHEHLGDAALGERGDVVPYLIKCSDQGRALSTRTYTDRAAADEPQPGRVAAGLLGRPLDHLDRLAD